MGERALSIPHYGQRHCARCCRSDQRTRARFLQEDRDCPTESLFDACQILEVDWHGITAMAQAKTNYQILPATECLWREDKLVAFDTALSKLIAPVETRDGLLDPRCIDRHAILG